jgi:preprotein translocase subunit SecD
MKIKKIFKNFRVIILIIFLLLAIVAINPDLGSKGVAIRNVLTNSSASFTGIERPKPTTPPMGRELIIAIDNKPIDTLSDYYDVVSQLKPNRTVQIRTDKGIYRLVTREKVDVIELNETVNKTVTEVVKVNMSETNVSEHIQNLTLLNETLYKTITKTVEVPKTKEISLGTEDIGFMVHEAPTTNIRKGLDLQGGTRVLLEPEKKISVDDLDMLLSNIKERLNIYGLSDIVVRESGDLSGNQYIVVEIAGVNEEEVKDLLARQGKFEANIGNSTVFRGGKDITYVCRSAECAGIDPTQPCGVSGDQWFCTFRFSMTLSPEAAKRQADATKDLKIITEDERTYLSEKLRLFLDNQMVDELSIGPELKGKTETNIQISGSGVGFTEQEAVFSALGNMKKLQTILITGSLPIKLNIIKTDSISTHLGEEFVKNALLIGLLAVLMVMVIVFIRYRKVQVVVPMMITVFSEVIILLGVAALIGWNIDLAAIAGILIVVGTGLDHQIVITDETLKGEIKSIFNWRERIKNAFFIIMAAYFTTTVAMLPLVFAGAGLLKGFALTTIIGVSIGVLITRPAYAAVIEILLKE